MQTKIINETKGQSSLAPAICSAAGYELEYSHGKFVIFDYSKRFAMQVVSVHNTLFEAEKALDHLKCVVPE